MQCPTGTLLSSGVLIAWIGLVSLFVPSVPWPGELPGDIVIEREYLRFSNRKR